MARLFTEVTDEESSSLKINLPDVKLPSLDDQISFTLNAHNEPIVEEKSKKKSTRKSKSTASSVANAVTGTMSGEVAEKDDMITTNKPYETKYQETTAMLKGSIMQLDGLLTDTMADAAMVRSSRTLKRKYDLLSMLNGNASQIIGNKITAIREINSTISKCNDLELKRMKELNFAAANEDSDKKIMDMYNAFVTMPVGDPSMGGMSQNNLAQISHSLSMGNVVTGTVYGEDDAAYQNYLANMNPAQRLNMYERNPNVKQVVVYDASNGNKFFQVMNMATGQAITGVPVRDPMFLEDTTIDLKNKIAKNINLNEVYPLVVINDQVTKEY